MGWHCVRYSVYVTIVTSLLGLLFSACLEVRGGDVETDGSPDDGEECKTCHHAHDAEELTRCDACHPENPTTGSHSAHIEWSVQGQRSACAECHLQPEKWFEEGHLDAVVQVQFGDASLAKTGSMSPVWTGSVCDNVYCHGSSLSGGSHTSPTWDGAQTITCGACHGMPPEDGHPSGTKCDGCHAAAYGDDGQLDPVRHVNGKVDMRSQEASR